MKERCVIMSYICPECNQENLEPFDAIIFQGMLSVLNNVIHEQDIDLECPHCRAQDVLVVHQSEAVWSARLRMHPEVPVNFEHPFEEGDYYWPEPPPADPYAILTKACEQLGAMSNAGSADYGLADLQAVKYRMVFAATIGAMEAFLADLLIRAVLSHDFVLKRLLETKDFVEEKVTLLTVYINPSIVTQKVHHHLTEKTLYHKLEKVHPLYKAAFKVSIFTDLELRARLEKAIKTRHDIVHRNGRNLEGESLELEKTAVDALLGDVLTFARSTNELVTQAIEKEKGKQN